MELVGENDSILKEKIEEYDFENGVDHEKLALDMADIMFANDGLGLAAPQVGLRHRMFLIGDKEGTIACFNPKVVNFSEETTIGSEGFGFIPINKELYHLPHVGSVLIGDNVWIGSNTTIEKSHIDQTIIEDHVKIDDLVQISHNTIIKEFTQISSSCMIAGKAKIGKNCWISPNSVIDVGCKIGDNCIVGTSSLVRKNFPNNCVIIGCPAKVLRKNN